MRTVPVLGSETMIIPLTGGRRASAPSSKCSKTAVLLGELCSPSRAVMSAGPLAPSSGPVRSLQGWGSPASSGTPGLVPLSLLRFPPVSSQVLAVI